MAQRHPFYRKIARLRGNRSTPTLSGNSVENTTTAVNGVCQRCGGKVGPLRPKATRPGCSGHQIVIHCPSCQCRIIGWVN